MPSVRLGPGWGWDAAGQGAAGWDFMKEREVGMVPKRIRFVVMGIAGLCALAGTRLTAWAGDPAMEFDGQIKANSGEFSQKVTVNASVPKVELKDTDTEHEDYQVRVENSAFCIDRCPATGPENIFYLKPSTYQAANDSLVVYVAGKTLCGVGLAPQQAQPKLDSFALYTYDNLFCITDSDAPTSPFLRLLRYPTTAPRHNYTFLGQHGDPLGVAMANGQVPRRELDVNGVIGLRHRNSLPVSLGSDEAIIYAYDPTNGAGGTTVFAMDSNGNRNQLASHANPCDVNPQAQCSFNDPSVALPFSFRHENDFIGRGAIVDLAKMVKYVEGKMQAELGEEPGRLVNIYDLPKSQTRTLEEEQAKAVERQADEAVQALSLMDWVPVELGPGGAIPPDAVEEVPETVKQERKIQVTEKELDLTQGRVVEVQREKTIQADVPTGRMTKQLTKNYKFEKGVLSRRPTLNDVNMEELAKPVDLPQWIRERVSGSGGVSLMNAAQMAERVRQKAQEKLAAAASE